MKSFFKLKYSDIKMLLFKKAALKPLYVNGQKTDTLEAVTVEATCSTCDLKIVLPPQAELLDIIESRFQFGDRFALEEEFDVEDIQICMFGETLSVKVYAQLRKEGNQ